MIKKQYRNQEQHKQYKCKHAQNCALVLYFSVSVLLMGFELASEK